MPFNGVQALVNGWIKVNSKHAVIPREEEQSDALELSNSQSVASMQTLAMRRNNRRNAPVGGEHVSHKTVGTADSTITTDSAARATRKQTKKKKQERKLQRTVSHTDLLREQAIEKAMSRKSVTKDEEFLSPSDLEGDPVQPLDSQHSRTSHRLDSDFPIADGSSESNGGTAQQSLDRLVSQPPRVVHRLKDGTIVHQKEIPQHSKPHHRRMSSENSGSEASRYRRQDSLGYYGEDGSSELSANRMRSTPPLHPRQEEKQKQNNPMQQFFRNFPHGGGRRCPSCDELEVKLTQAQNDIEYLRGVALRAEYVCNHCKNKDKAKTGHLCSKTNEEALTLKDASTRLVDLTTRHKGQIQQMTLEQSRWQHDMNLKLSKFAMMCKDLNEESEIRQNEALRLEADLKKVKEERDSLTTENLKLRTEVEQSLKLGEEFRELQERMIRSENNSLEQTADAITLRDEVIVDLSSKLRQALERLEDERAQVRQRRQIIFPTARTIQHNHQAEGANKIAALNDELKRAKEEARRQELVTEQVKADAAKKEVAWMVRLENLERQVAKLKKDQKK